MSAHKKISEHLDELASPVRKRMKPEFCQLPASQEFQRIANDSVADSVNPPLRQSSSLDPHRGVTPTEDETVEETVFRILGERILKLVITGEGATSTPSSSRKLALRYRAVCPAWRDTIHDICFDIGIPLFDNSSRIYELQESVPFLKDLKSLSSLLAHPPGSGVSSSVLPPVSLTLDLTFFKGSIAFGASALNCLRKIDRMLLRLTLLLGKDTLEGCSSLHLENLKYAEFKWYKAFTPEPDPSWKIVQDFIMVAPTLETLVLSTESSVDNPISTNLPELPLPKTLKKLQLTKVKPPMWLIDVAPTLLNLNSVILNVPPAGFPGAEPVGQEESLLIAKLGKSLESLELTEILLQQPYQLEQPSTFSILEPMRKLRTLKLDLSNRKVGELKNYKDMLPSLTDLEVNGRWDRLHFPASWYSSPCFTLRRLSVHLKTSVYAVPPLPQNLLVRLSRNFPNLEELELTCDEFEGNNWQVVLCHGFPNLRKLSVECEKVRSEGRNRLAAAISGIPWEKLQSILRNPKGLGELVSKYKHCPSLRDLKHLQQLKLRVRGFEEDQEGNKYGVATDSSIMIHSSFLHMSNLKLVELNRAFKLTDEAIQFAREATGLIIKSVRFAGFEYNHIPYR